MIRRYGFVVLCVLWQIVILPAAADAGGTGATAIQEATLSAAATKTVSPHHRCRVDPTSSTGVASIEQVCGWMDKVA